MAEFTQFKFASVVLPVPAGAAGESLLESCDPTVAKLLAFLKSVITTYVGAAVVAAATPAATSTTPITVAVKMTAPVDPGRVAQVDQLAFPLLAVWRKSMRGSERTLNWDQVESKLGFAYVLPPLSAAQMIRITPVLTSIAYIIAQRLKQQFDPAFNSGENILNVLGLAKLALETAEFGSFEWKSRENVDFPALQGELVVNEQAMPLSTGLTAYAGADITVSQQDSDVAVPLDMLVEKTDVG